MRQQAIDDFKSAAHAYNAFVEWFGQNRILFPSNTCDMFDNAAHKFKEAHFNMRTALEWEQTPFEGSGQSAMNLRRSASKTGTEVFPGLVKAIEGDLRRLIGIEENPAK